MGSRGKYILICHKVFAPSSIEERVRVGDDCSFPSPRGGIKEESFYR